MRYKWIWVIVGGVLLSLFILGTSYAWYNAFSQEISVIANLEISINDGGKGVTVRDMLPMSDKEGKKLEPYQFTIQNKSSVSGSYRIFFEETPFNKIQDGCTEEQLLLRNQLRYQLKVNGVEVQVGSLEEIKNNVLITRNIEGNQTDRYELRVWLPDLNEGDVWMNKHYHYHITAQVVDTEV